MNVNPISTTRIHKDHPKDQIIGDINSAIQTRRMINFSEENAMVSYISKQRRTNHKDYQNCLFAYFLSQIEPKKVIQALTDPKLDRSNARGAFCNLNFKRFGLWWIFLKGKEEYWELRGFIETRKDERRNCKSETVRWSAQGYTKRKELIMMWFSGFLLLGLKGNQTTGLDPLMYHIASGPRHNLLCLCLCKDCLDRKSTTGGCQFLGKRLISWQCKKQTIVANSTTEAEYVATTNCFGQVLWIQNQMLDYGFNFMNTKIYIDNESTICVVKNLVFHSKTKHIKIRHHFIRDSYEKKFIQVIKIHTDHNVSDLLTKAFDVSKFNFFIASIGLLNLRRLELKGYLINNGYADLFWNTATSKTVNSVKQIHAIVDGKAIVITESSVRNDLLFDDEDVNIKDLKNNRTRAKKVTGSLPQTSKPLDLEQMMAVHKEGCNSVERAITMMLALIAVQKRIQVAASGAQYIMGVALAQIRSKSVLEKPMNHIS
ncbi:hypothetical protein Tco_0123905 [Tanacetum coccineum]